MKKTICLSLCLALPLSATLAIAAPAEQLQVQKTSALAAHLTTRIQWTEFPQLRYSNADLKQQNRAAILRINADESGQINKVTVQESTGLKSLDQLISQAVKQARIKPHLVDDTPVPVIGYQVFHLDLKDTAQDCHYSFDSTVWQAQQAGAKSAFQYRSQPQLNVTEDELNGHARRIQFKMKADKYGNIHKVKIQQGSGRYALDQKLIQALQGAQVDVPRKFWIYKKSSLKDEVRFQPAECEG
ncbi:energy transducer TonB [Acinetobacter indicus]|uniref:Energy transducer TonB n=1 Tax=Acinetobacter indicus TaxID=756892 RepID=A0A6C0Y494_9GAMM|nr:energy transducer TonB [Acinetobacter indicus]QIC71067.1 energy transducer TonB [Acinetobacter indicus]